MFKFFAVVFSTVALVLSVAFNGGSPNRSGLATVQVTTSAPVTVKSASSLILANRTTGTLHDASAAMLSGNGTSQVSWNVLVLSLPEGVYTAVLPADQTTPPLSSDYAMTFHILPGDLNGDRKVDMADLDVFIANFSTTPGPYGPGDCNGDGVVNLDDFSVWGANNGRELVTP